MRATLASGGAQVNIAVGYGGRREIADAVRSLLYEHAKSGGTLEELAEILDVDHIAEHLYTRGQPDPDLVIRTSGEQRLSGFLLPRGAKKPQRVNPSLFREMWRCSASLELLPLGTKTELGEALIKRVKAGDFKESELWCLGRLGARKLFYGPINLVIPPATVSRWVDTLLRLPAAGDALAAMARRTES